MQVLKPEKRDLILKSAERVFYKHGFRAATTRMIADSCKISVSNLYLYFKNKNDIFDAVISAFYNQFQDGFTRFIDHFDDRTRLENRTPQIVDMLTDIISQEKRKFIILFSKSHGTKYENYHLNIINLLLDHIEEQKTIKVSREISTILLKNLFSMVLEIALIVQTREKLEENLYSVISYHMHGMLVFM